MLWCVPALPLAAFLLLLCLSTCSRSVLKFIGVAGIFLSFVASAFLSYAHYGQASYREILWTWIPPSEIAFVLDSLSIIMILVITFVGVLVALYSTQFMSHDPDFARFFAYLNLFVASMLILVLADNILLLFAGWEGVGLCSYLLIGFWYQRSETTIAANKAIIITRIGDVFFLLGIIYLYLELNTLNISTALSLMNINWSQTTLAASIIALCFTVGSAGKSAQVPLHTWLPDAMLGPTPASALIHAATMVTAGVYLMARFAPLYDLTPNIQQIVILMGAITLVLGSWCALRQSDLKRVLAYSTISQIGYMFLALGVGSPAAAMFHFTTHAFFKALLFLCAGIIGEALHHEYNMYKMGGLRKELPLTFYTFLMGSAALAGLPLISSGFYSKELILGESYLSEAFGLAPWIMGCLGAFLTALYVGRMIILVFFGKALSPVREKPTWPMNCSLIILGILSLSAGLFEGPILDALNYEHHDFDKFAYIIASIIPIIGLLLAVIIYKNKKSTHKISILSFDHLYKLLLIKPYIKLANFLKPDYFIKFYNLIAIIINYIYKLLSQTQTGRIEQYLALIIASALTILGYMVLS